MSEHSDSATFKVDGGDRVYRMVLPDHARDYIQGQLARDGQPYEHEMLKDLASRVPPGAVVVDAGANVGNHSIYLAMGGVVVWAFEPNAGLAEAISASSRTNGLDDLVTVRPVALGARPERGSFAQELPDNIGGQEVVTASDGEFDIVRLDDEPLAGPVAAMKLDVEGAELDVLRGAEGVIARDRPILYVECRDKAQFLQVNRWLSERGYAAWEQFNATPTFLYRPVESMTEHERADRGTARAIAAGYDERERTETARRMLAEANLKYRAATQQVHQLRELVTDREAKVTALEQQHREALEQIDQATRRADDEARTASERAQAAETAAQALVAAEARVRILRTRLRHVEEELESTRGQVGSLRALVQDLRSSIKMRTGQAVRDAHASPNSFARLPFALLRLRREHAERARQVVEAAPARPAAPAGTAAATPEGDHRQEGLEQAPERVGLTATVGASGSAGVGTRPRVAAVMDEFTRLSFAPEWDITDLTPAHWEQQLAGCEPELLFVESAWRGSNGTWHNTVLRAGEELRSIVEWCRARGVPTVFWNKEDPVHFSTFRNAAALFDHVFTTDLDCIAEYKAALGHDRVWFLPFAVQPTMHNPIEQYERKDAFVFAGAYYQRYPERTRDLESFVQHLPKLHPVEIYDRNFDGTDPAYKFPESYADMIVGTLPASDVSRAYKGYTFAINMNSVKQSQTMFARRAFELLASNTVTVSNFSRGLRTVLGNLLISSDSGAEVVRQLRKLQDDGRLAHLRLAGVRAVMSEHTYAHRAAEIWARVGGQERPTREASVHVLSRADGSAEVARIQEALRRQVHQRWRATLVVPADVEVPELDERVRLVTPDAVVGSPISALVDEGADTVAVLWPGDHYGPHYLSDLELGFTYVDAAVVGKSSFRAWDGTAVTVVAPGSEYRPANGLAVRRSMARLAVVRDVPADAIVDASEHATWTAEHQVALDSLGYCADAPEHFDAGRWGVDDDSFHAGWSFAELAETAAAIPAAPARSGEPSARVTSLGDVFGGLRRPDVEVVALGPAVRVVSELPEGKHEYLYAANPTDVPADWFQAGEVYVETGTGLDLSLAILFLDGDGVRLGSANVVANRNVQVTVPGGTTSVRLGLRVRGPGETELRSVDWHARDVTSTALVLPTADHLVLTNIYPSYESLYRNGFVHSRVRAYRERGVRAEVVCVQPGQASTFREFEDVSVLHTNEHVARRIVADGHHRGILVHFLNPAIWSALQSRVPGTPVVVWIHGVEVQPWWRRSFNFTSDAQLEAEKVKSEARLAFWRDVFTRADDNLQFVFVSQYLADEVMTDVGVTLPPSRYSIVHNPIDTDLFGYRPKSASDRLAVLSIRPFASRTYANDLSVEAVLRLSKEPEFGEMRFRFIGDGQLFDETLEPLRDFENVQIERRFLTQREIAEQHREHGVFLVPTRMDTQGVSRDEAMSSGLVPVSNAVAAVPEFVDDESGVLVPGDDAPAIADALIGLVRDPDRFLRLSAGAADRVRRQAAADLVVSQELGLILGGDVV